LGLIGFNQKKPKEPKPKTTQNVKTLNQKKNKTKCNSLGFLTNSFFATETLTAVGCIGVVLDSIPRWQLAARDDQPLAEVVSRVSHGCHRGQVKEPSRYEATSTLYGRNGPLAGVLDLYVHSSCEFVRSLQQSQDTIDVKTFLNVFLIF